jgi:hypothetical protein
MIKKLHKSLSAWNQNIFVSEGFSGFLTRDSIEVNDSFDSVAVRNLKNCNMKIEEAKLIAKENHYFPRMIREAIEIVENPQYINLNINQS